MVVATTLFMCIFAAQSRAFGTVAADTIPIIEKDLDRFPMVKHDPDLSQVKGLVIGDSIPDYLWDLPLWVVNHPDGRDTMTLREYEGSKLLVLDFWAPWCTPCIKSVEKWRELKAQFPDDIAVVTVHMDYDYKALPFAAKRGWKFPVVIGESTVVINRHFFIRNRVGGVVWIKDGKCIAIPELNGYDERIVKAVITDDNVRVKSHPVETYFWEEGPDNPNYTNP